MTNLPDFSARSETEQVEWLTNNDTSEPLALASRASHRWTHVDAQGNEVLQTTAFRLPPSMIAEIDEAVGNDKGGRSGLVRTAIRSYLDQLRQRRTEAVQPDPLDHHQLKSRLSAVRVVVDTPNARGGRSAGWSWDSQSLGRGLYGGPGRIEDDRHHATRDRTRREQGSGPSMPIVVAPSEAAHTATLSRNVGVPSSARTRAGVTIDPAR